MGSLPGDSATSNPSDGDGFQTPRIYVEGTWLYGAIVASFLYGIAIVLYVMCFHSLWCRIRSHDGTHKKQWFFFIYVNVVFALNTVFVSSNAQITNLGFINNRNYPGGPGAYESHTSPASMNIPFIVTNWFTDALMMWRCHVVYRDSRYHLLVTMLGCLMLFASVVTGSLWAIVVSRPDSAGPSSTEWMSFNLFFPYLSVSLAINIFICTLTVLRLMYHRACISKAFGPEYGVLYTGIASMMIESAAVYSISSLLYLIPYGVNSPLSNAFCQILGEAQVIAPLLIIYRVAEGKAWERDVSRRLGASSSFVLRGLATSPSMNITSQGLNEPGIQVALQCMPLTDTECGNSIPTLNEQSDGVAMEHPVSRSPLSLDLGSVQRSPKSVGS